MTVLATGLGLLFAAFVVHLLLWRFYRPRNHTVGLLLVFAATPLVLLGVSQPPLLETLHAMLLYASGAFTYIILYSAIEEQSPTLFLVSHLAACGEHGCSDGELTQQLGGIDAVSRRLDLMLRTGLIREENGLCVLTGKGRRLAQLFAHAAAILGLKQGG